jgi:hypothetical protein
MNNSAVVNYINENIAHGKTGKYGTDFDRVQKHLTMGGAHLVQFLDLICDLDQIKTMKQKPTMRFLECIRYALNGDVETFDSVSAYMISTVLLTKQDKVTYQDAHFMMGVNTDGANHIRGVSRAKLSKFLGNGGSVGTISSKVSRTVAPSGFFTALGISIKGDKHSYTLTDSAKSHPFILAYCAQLEKMGDGTLALLKSKEKMLVNV